MKRFLILPCLSLLAFECAAERLLFADEFDKPGLPDPATWRYEEGWVRNQESQWYSKADPANTWIEDGTLRITARELEEPRPNPAENPAGPGRPWGPARDAIRYTSGSIDTKGRFAFQYGRVEVRARLPKGQGVWPAIWTLGVWGGHPACGEIDIMEYVWSSRDRVWATLHFPGRYDMPANERSGAYAGPEVQDGEFHLYGMTWDPEQITFTFDGKPYYTFTLDRVNQPDGTNPFRQPHYIKLNLALGAEQNWGGKLDPAILPQTFEVDYVRVYQ